MNTLLRKLVQFFRLVWPRMPVIISPPDGSDVPPVCTVILSCPGLIRVRIRARDGRWYMQAPAYQVPGWPIPWTPWALSQGRMEVTVKFGDGTAPPGTQYALSVEDETRHLIIARATYRIAAPPEEDI